MAKVAKKLFFDLDNIGRVNAKSGSTFNPGGSNRTAEIADTGVVGYSEEPVAPTVEFSILNDGTVSIADVRDLTDISVTVQDDNGQVWVVSNCFVTEPPQLSNGEINVKMSGLSADAVS